MAKRVLNRLGVKQVEKLNAPGRHSDGGGLYLFIDDASRRRWIFMYVRRGQRVELGLGGVRDMTLASARDQATALRAVLAKGGDPKTVRLRDDEVPTFGEAADDYIEAMKSGWKNEKHHAQWSMTLKKYADPIRHQRVDEITTQDILEILKPLWNRVPVTAKRLRGRIENILDAARAKGHRSGENPARWRGHLDQVLPKRHKLAQGHHAALPYDALPKFMEDLRDRPATAACALEFVILNASRTSEVLSAKWGEIDFEKKLWTIPAARMKTAREHRVPLSSRSIKVLVEQKKKGSDGYIFCGPNPKKPLSTMSMSMLLRRMKYDITVHGFRSTFRDWASETTGFSHEVCEMALAHTIANKVEAAYRRGDLFEKRHKLMETWATYCMSPPVSKVLQFKQPG